MESKKRFSPSKLLPDFDRRYSFSTKIPIIDTVKLPNPIKVYSEDNSNILINFK